MELDGYHDLTAIGSGGNAYVYRAHNDAAHAVAIKVLHGGGDPAVARRFRREVQLMGALADIDGLVPVLDFGTTNAGDPFLVMPLFAGGSLAEHVRRGPMSWSRAASLVRVVAIGLQRAHDLEILHLDVKPANILLDTVGKPWLGDFGIAEMVGSTASMSGAMMTPAYTPPERLEDSKPTKLTDVYGLGATLFALLAGEAPFGATTKSTNPAAVMMSVLNDPVPVNRLPSEVPSELAELIERSMAKTPDDRLASPSIIADRLSEILTIAGEPLDDFGAGDTGDATIVGAGPLRAVQPSPAGVSKPVVELDPEATVVARPSSELVDSSDGQAAPSSARNRWLAAASLVVAVVAAVAIAAAIQSRGGNVQTAASDPSIETTSDTDQPSGTDAALFDESMRGTTVDLVSDTLDISALEFFADGFTIDSGIDLEVIGSANLEAFADTVSGPEPPALVLSDNATQMREWCADGTLHALGGDAVAQLESDYHDGLVLRDGGSTCGAAFGVELDFVLWFNPRAMERSGYAVPSTWDEVVAAAAEMTTAGETPWCIGLEDAGSVVGMPSKWVENILLRTASLEVYDALFGGVGSWNGPEVAAAFTWLDDFLTDENVYGGRAGALETSAADAVAPMFGIEPGCYFYAGPQTTPNLFLAVDPNAVFGFNYDFISFPALDARHGDRQLVRAQLHAATSDRPEVVASLRHLLSTEAQDDLAGLGLQSANRNVNQLSYIGESDRQLAEATRAAEAIRVVDFSRLPPSAIIEWDLQVLAFLRGERSLDEALETMDEVMVSVSG